MTSRKHIVIVISDVDKSLAFEWIARELSTTYRLSFLLLNRENSQLEGYLKANGHFCKRLTVVGKRSYPKVFLQLLGFFFSTRPHLVHAHLLTAQILALPAAFLAGIRRRVYTRHTSDYHHKYHRKGIWYDRLSNHFATTIVSISQATQYVLRQLENVPETKIKTIHHGFDFSSFVDVDQARKQSVMRRWNIQHGPVVGVIARHIEWKGIQYVVPAFRKLLETEPEAILVLANAQGPYNATILELLASMPEKNYRLIPFEADSGALYQCFDVYVHTPVDATCEAFGQTYVEALAAGIPAVFTLSGVATEFIKDGVYARVVNYRDSDQIYSAVKSLLQDSETRKQMIDNAREFVVHAFRLERMIDNLRKLYE